MSPPRSVIIGVIAGYCPLYYHSRHDHHEHLLERVRHHHHVIRQTIILNIHTYQLHYSNAPAGASPIRHYPANARRERQQEDRSSARWHVSRGGSFAELGTQKSSV